MDGGIALAKKPKSYQLGREMSDDVRVRIDQAFNRYLAIHNVTWKLGDDLNKLFDQVEAAEVTLIETLGAIWRELTGKSPRSRMRENQYPFAERYPFADWVACLFPDYTELFASPPTRIRKILKSKTAVFGMAHKA